MATEKMSRSDILMYAIEAGLSYDQAEDLAYALSPECRTVAKSRVVREVAKLAG